jgi:hypothetical protein
LSDTDTGAADAWIAGGDMQGAQALNHPIPDNDSPAGEAASREVPAWFQHHNAAQRDRDSHPTAARSRKPQ